MYIQLVDAVNDEEFFNEEDFVCFKHTGRCFYPWKCPHAVSKEVLAAREVLAMSQAKVLEVANVEVAMREFLRPIPIGLTMLKFP